jgi:hypothetical protein
METLKKTDDLHTVELDNIKPPPHYDPANGPQVVTSDTARSGPMGRPVYLVLIVSLAAVIVALGLVAWFVR